MLVFLQTLSVFLSISAFLLIFGPYLPFSVWWTRAGVYVRQQLMFVLPFLIIFDWVTLGATSLTAMVLTMGLSVGWAVCLHDLWSFLPFARKESSEANNDLPNDVFSVLILNVLQDNQEFSSVRRAVLATSADIVFMCETNAAWAEELTNLQDYYPFKHLLPLEDYNGLLFYSRLEIISVQERYLCQDYIPSLTVDVRGKNGSLFTVYALHPRPPRPKDSVQYLDNEIKQVANEISEGGRPAIVIGDLNEVGWSPAVRQVKTIGSLYDPRQGRGIFNTYNAHTPLMRWPLDHLFHTSEFRTVSIQRLESCGSDHFPIKFTMQLN